MQRSLLVTMQYKNSNIKIAMQYKNIMKKVIFLIIISYLTACDPPAKNVADGEPYIKPPADFSLNYNSATRELSWQTIDNYYYYQIEHSAQSDTNFITYRNSKATALTIPKNMSGTFRIKACLALSAQILECSSASNSISAATDDAPVAIAPIDTITLAEDTTATITLNGSDADGDTFTYEIAMQPANGSVTVSGNTATYTPDADYNGSDSFAFRVTDGDGVDSQPAIVNITISAVNDAPVAIAATDTITLAEDTTTTITLSGSDVDGDTFTYQIAMQPANGSVTINGNITTYTPDADYSGSDSFAFTVTDDNIVSQPAIVNITISAVNDAPVAIAATDTITLAEDTTTTITLRGSDADDGDTLTYQIAMQPANGSVTISGNIVTYTPDADHNGSDSFAFTVTDDATPQATSESATVNITISAVNDAPVALASTITLTEDSTATIELSGSDVDGATGTLTYQITTEPANGTFAITGNTVTYTPNADHNGSDSFAFTVTDDGGAISQPATVNIIISAVNDAPVAIAPTDTITLAEDTTATITLSGSDADGSTLALTYQLAISPTNGIVTITGTIATYTPKADYNGNDSFTFRVTDGNGVSSQPATVNIIISAVNDAPVAIAPTDTITLAEDTTATIILSGSDVDGSTLALTYQLAIAPTNGIVTITGTIATYTPKANHNGSDSFAFTVTDDATPQAISESATVNITISPVNDAPIAIAPTDTITLAEDTTTTIILSGSDVDGSTLALTYQLAITPTNGIVTITGTIATYTPKADYNGNDSFAFTVNDGDMTSQSATVNIIISAVNDAPVAIAPTDTITLAEDTTATITLSGSDVDGSTLALTYQLAILPTNGIVTITGTIATYTPKADYNGNDSFAFTVNDGDMTSQSATVNITISAVNDAPVAIAPTDTITLAEDTTATIILSGSDVDGSTLALTYQLAILPTNGIVTITGTIATYTPKADYNGNDSFAFTVNDGDMTSQSATVNIIISAVNDAPVAIAPTDTITLAEDTTATITLSGSDVDGSTLALTYQLAILPTNGIVTITGTIATYTPKADYNGNDSFAFTVNDGDMTSQSATVNITISAVNDAPVAIAPTDTITLAEDTTATIILSGSDVDGSTLALTYQLAILPTNGIVTITGTIATYTPKADYNGNDSFAFTVNDGDMTSQSATVNISISAVNDAPVAIAPTNTIMLTEDSSTPITLSGSDVDGSTLALTYQLAILPTNGIVTITGTIATYTPKADYNGNDSFAFTVNDGDMTSQSATVNITISAVNDAPVAIAPTDTITLAEDTTATIILSGSDVDGSTLALTYQLAILPTNGIVTITGTIATYTPKADYNGNDSFAFTVNDGDMTSQSATVNISISAVNDAPVAIAPTNTIMLTEDSSTPITLSGSDVDGSTLALTYQLAISPTNGIVTITGTIATYTPKADYNGNDSFAFTVNDGDMTSQSATVNITISAVNDAPVAIAPTDTITLAEDTTATIILSGSDVDGSTLALTYQLAISPTNGIVTITGTIATYTPKADYNGNDSFAFTVNDGDMTSQSATVNIIISAVNDAPVAIAPTDTITLAEDTTATITLSGSDVDGSTLALTYQLAILPTNGIVTITGTIATYTPKADYNGNDSFAFTVNDGDMTSQSATVNITISAVNDAPVAIAPTDTITLAEDTTATIILSGSDVDGSTLALTYQLAILPTNGIVTITGTIATYTPKADYNGNDSFAFTVNDGDMTSQSATVNITISAVNDAPVAIAPTDTITLAEDTTATIILIGNDADDGDTLTYQIAMQPANGSVTISGNIVTYTPDADYNGSDSFAFTVTDDGGTISQSATVNIIIMPVNDAPIANDLLFGFNQDSNTTTIILVASDIDGDALSYTVVTNPHIGVLSGTAPNLSYVQNGKVDTSFTFRVTDDGGVSVTATATILNRTLTVVSSSKTSIALAWNSGNYFKLYRIISSTETMLIYEGTDLQYADTSLTIATSYSYEIAYCTDADTCATQLIRVDTATVPSTPAFSEVIALSRSEIRLSWNAVTGASTYRIYRSTQANGVYTALDPIASTTTTIDTGLEANTRYYYQISACTLMAVADMDGKTCNRNTTPASATTTIQTSIYAEYSLVANNNNSDNHINLSWTTTATNFVRLSVSTATNADVTNTGFIEIYSGTTNSFVHINLTSATNYYYRLQLCGDSNIGSCIDLNSVSSTHAVTAPNIYNFGNFAQRNSSSDFDSPTLTAAGNTNPRGIWSDGTTMWVVDNSDDKIYAYNLATKARDSSNDFDSLTLTAAGNTDAYGIWSDGTTTWVADATDFRLYAYNLANKTYENTNDFDSLAAGNTNLSGIWSDGTTMWAADTADGKLYAYTLASKNRNISEDFNSPTLAATGNAHPAAIWSNGTTMWVVDSTVRKVYAYNLATKTSDSGKDFDTLTAADNNNPQGIWSDGSTMWVVDSSDDKLYAYDFSFIESVTTQSSTQIALSWDGVAGASIYRIYRSTQLDGVYTQLNSVTSTSTIDDGLAGSTKYYYQIAACTLDNTVDSVGISCSDRTNTSAKGSATTMPSSDNYSLTFNNSDTQIALNWSSTATNFVRLSVSTATDTGFTEIYSGTATSYIHTDLVAATSYYYRLQLCGDNSIGSCFSLDSVSNERIATTPDIYNFNNFAEYNSGADFDNLIIGDNSPGGIWSDGTTMWVADINAFNISAYNLVTEARDSSQDFLNGSNDPNTPFELWSDGTTMWVTNFNLTSTRIFAYTLATKARNSIQDFTNTLTADMTTVPSGIWSDGTTMWVALVKKVTVMNSESTDSKVYAYNLATKHRDSSQDFNNFSDDNLGSSNIRGIWSDGTIMWLADATNQKLYAYNLATKTRDSDKDFSLNDANANPQGIWSGGANMWVADSVDDKLYTYDLGFISTVTAQSSAQIALSWDALVGASIYRIYRSTQIDGVYTQLNPVTSTSTTDGGLAASTKYYYQIAACTLDNTTDSSGTSCIDRNHIAAKASATTLPSSDATYSLVVANNNGSETQINLSWTTTNTNFVRISVSTATDTGFTEIYSGTATSFVNTNLASGTVYYYRLQLCADNSLGSCFSLDSVSSQQAATVPDIYDFNNFAQRNSSSDFDSPTLTAAGNTNPRGIWSDGTTMWVVDNSDDKIYAYNLATKARESSNDFDSLTLTAAGNTDAYGIWSDGTTTWVADATDFRLYAYNLANKTYENTNDFDSLTLTAAGNTDAYGIWSDGTTTWVADTADGKLYAYTLASKNRNISEDFNSPTLAATGNAHPAAIWSNGTTMWVVDSTDRKLYAYNLATKTSDSGKGFDTLAAADNNNPQGIWSDGSTMWVVDSSDDKLYAYDFSFIEAVTTQSSNQIALSWDGVAGASIYRIYRSTQIDGVYTPLNPVASTSTIDGSLAFSTKYYYQIAACTLDNTIDSAGASCSDRNNLSARGSATTMPSSDAAYSLVFNNSGETQIDLSWTTTETNFVRISVSTATDTGFIEIYSGTATNFVNTNLASGTVYYYRLQLCGDNSAGSCFDLDSVSSQQFATVPNIYNFSHFAEHTSSNDLTALEIANNNSAVGIWSDGTTMWVVDNNDNKIYAYNLATGVRDSNKDFDTLDAGNNSPQGIWSDGTTTMWVANNSSDHPNNDKIYAYNLATGVRESDKDFDTLNDAGNNFAQGIWSDGTTMWVADTADGKIYAYNLADKARDSSKDFTSADLTADNSFPRQIWSNGTTMWVVNTHPTIKVYAYNLATKRRFVSNDVNTLIATGNTNPTGIWSNGAIMWIADIVGDRLYAYDLSFISTVTALSSSQITLSWDAVAGASIYRVYRSTQIDGVYTALNPVASTSITEGGFDASTKYYYQIAACSLDNIADSVGNSCSDRNNPAAQASATTMPGSDATYSLVINNNNSDSQIDLSWTTIGTNFVRISVSTTDTNFITIYSGTATSFVNTNLASGTFYNYRLQLCGDNSAGSCFDINTVSSQQAYTVPHIPTFGKYNSGNDFDTLGMAGNAQATGIWSDNTTMWVVDRGDAKIYAYNLATKQYDSNKDFNTLTAANANPQGIWSDGTTMWVLDYMDLKIYAYDLATKAYDGSKDFNNLNNLIISPREIWSGGTTMWVADNMHRTIYAHNLANKQPDNSQIFDTLNGAGNDSPFGIWSDGTTMWVADSAVSNIYAYKFATKQRDSNKEFSALSTGNTNPTGIWSDGSTMWVADSVSSKIYAYDSFDFIVSVTALASTQIALSWNDIAGASIYRVYRSTEVAGIYTQLSPVTSTSTTDGDLVGNTRYYYQIVACLLDNAADSCSDREHLSAQASATTTMLIASTAEYSLVVNNSSETQIELSWTTTGTNFVRISVSTTTDTGFTEIYSGTATSFVNTNLASGTIYYYRVQLCDDNKLGNCVSLDSVQSEKTATIPAIPAFGQYNSSKDFNTNTLTAADNTNPRGIWSDGTTMWIVDNTNSKIYAYNLATMDRDSSKDFNSQTLTTAITHPTYIASDGTTMWIVDSTDGKLYAYNLATKTRDSGKDFDTLTLTAENANPQGIWSDGTTMWVANSSENKIYVYNLATKTRVSNKDIDLEAANGNAAGIWSDGTTMWVADFSSKKVYAYNLATKSYNSSKDINALADAGNESPRGIWSDNYTMWVADSNVNKLYAYNLNFITATTQSSTQITLSWDAVTGASIYRIYRSTEVDGVYTQIKSVASTSTIDGSFLAASTKYYYQIAACTLDNTDDSVGASCSDRNNLAARGSATTMPSGDAYILAFDNSETQIDLSWTTTATNFVRVSVSATTDTGFTEIYSGTATSIVDTNLASGTIYYYRVQLCGDNSAGSCFSLDSVQSEKTATTPDIYNFNGFADRNSSSDFDPLDTDNSQPFGIWSDGTTMWVVDDSDDKIYAYNLATKDRDISQDFTNTLIVAGNTNPSGIWSDGTTMWVANISGNFGMPIAKLYAYNLATKARDSDKDFNSLSGAGNRDPHGIWSDGTTMWVADRFDKKLYAYDFANKVRDSSKDFNNLVSSSASSGISYGIWSDGTTMWVAEITVFPSGNDIYAYNLTTKQRDTSKEINTVFPNSNPRGIWSDGTAMWVADVMADSLYAYDFSFIEAVTTQSSNQIALSWKAVTDASIYRIYRSTEVDGVYTALDPVASTSVIDTDLDATTKYYYQIAACTLNNTDDSIGASCSDRNNIAARGSATTMPDSGAYILTFNKSETQIDLSWTTTATNFVRVSVSTATDTGFTEIYSGTATSLVDTNLASGTVYYYRLQLCGDNSPDSCLSLNSFNSQQAATVPDIYNFNNFAQRNSSSDFDSPTLAVANTNPQGIWSDGTTMWVANGADRKIYAYNLATKARESSNDFDTLSAAGNLPRGIWSDGTTMWVADTDGAAEIYAYNLATKVRDSDKDFDSLSGAGNNSPSGIWSDGTTMWVVDTAEDGKIYAYTLATKARDSSKDFNNLDADYLKTGIWSDGTTMWVVNWLLGNDATLFAYNLATKQRDSSKDVALDSANRTPTGIWSDGSTMWTADTGSVDPTVQSKIYAYDFSFIEAVTALSKSEIKLSWDAIAGASIYRIYRSTQVDGVYTQLNPVASTSVIDTGLDTTTKYYYQIAACTLNNTVDSAGTSCSDRNNPAVQGNATTTKLPSIDAEYSLVLNNNNSDNSINLSWTTTATNFVRISVSTATNTGFTEIDIGSGTATSYIHTGRAAATSYYYRLQICGDNSIDSCFSLDSVSSQQITTAPNIYSATSFSDRDSSNDFNTLIAAGNTNPRGIWSDGTTMWISNYVDHKLYAYNLATKAQDSTKDFNLNAGNTEAFGIWSDGTIMWVVDASLLKTFAYNFTTKAYDSSNNFDLTGFVSGSNSPYGISSNGTTIWVSDFIGRKIYAYTLATKVRDSSNDFNTLIYDDDNPSGIWTDGTTMWVANLHPGVFAYNLATKQRDTSKDFAISTADGNNAPRGLWSDGSTMWVLDSIDPKLYAYNFSFIETVTALSKSEIKLSWDALTGASIYRVYRSTQVDGVYTALDPVASTSVIDTGLDATTKYYYQIAACTLNNTVDSAGTSCSDRNNPSVQASATTTKLPNTDAEYSLVLNNNNSDNSINLSWTTTATNFVRISVSTATNADVTNTGFIETYSGTATSFVDTNLTSATIYYYRLQLCGDNSIDSCFSLDSAKSQRTATTPNIYNFSNFSQSDSSNDFNTLNAENNNPFGIWSDGTTMWVSDTLDDMLYAYTLTTKAYDNSKNFNNLMGVTSPSGIWSDGTTIWVVNANATVVSAYTLATKAGDSSKDLVVADSNFPLGIWSNGTTAWVGDHTDSKIYAYNLATKAYDSSNDFNTLTSTNGQPFGIWSDSTTMWVAHSSPSRVYAYNLATKQRDSSKDFNTLNANNTNPRGLWSDGATMWVAEGIDNNKLHAYDFSFIEAVTAQSSTQIALSWDAVAGASIYRIYRSTAVAGVYTQLNPVTSTSATDGGLVPSTDYYYQIAACTLDNTVDSAGVSCSDRNNPAAQASIATSDVASNLTFNNIGETQIGLSWTTTGTNFVRISVSTAIDADVNNTGFTEIYSGTATSFVDTNLTSATIYYYRVQLCGDNSIGSCVSLDGADSQKTATIPAIPVFGQYNSSKDFNTLDAAGNTFPEGIWSDGTTMWVSDITDSMLYAYNLATKARTSSQDFTNEILTAAGHTETSHIWSDGTTMWVLDSIDLRIYAYNLTTKDRVVSKDFLLTAVNTNPAGFWSDGTTMWVADVGDDKIYAYNLATKAYDSSKDFNTLSPANASPEGIWSDGTTMWVADTGDAKIYAYNLATKARDSSKDINTLVDAGNDNPRGIWSDGSTMWVADPTEDKLYAYDFSFIAATTQSSTQIALSWDAVAGASIYRIYRSTAVAGVYTQIKSVTSTSTIDSGLGLAASTKYYYQIAACTLDNTADSAGASCSDRNRPAAQGSATTMPGGDAKYSLAFNSSETQVDLSWTTTATNFVRISVSTATDAGFTEIYSGTATSYIHTDLAATTSYYYKLQLCGDNSIGSCFSLESIGNSQTATVPYIPSFGQYNSSNDFNTLNAAGNTAPSGIWSDGTTMWVSDTTDNMLYAYTLTTKVRDSSKDFDDLDFNNANPIGIWSNGTTMWVLDTVGDRIYAYNLETKAYDSSKDFNTLTGAGNTYPRGIWSNGTTMWVIDVSDDKIYAYNLETKAYDSSKDFNTLTGAGNADPRGIWSDGTTMWVVDFSDEKLYAYNLATKAYDSTKDINTLTDAGNRNPIGIWSDNSTMWVVDDADEKLYAYNANFIATITTQSSTQIALSWDAVAGASIYRIYRSTAVAGVYTQLNPPVTSTSTIDGGLVASTKYYYQIAACTLDNTVDSAGTSCSDRNNPAAQGSATTMGSAKILYGAGVQQQPQISDSVFGYIDNTVELPTIVTSDANNSNPVIANQSATLTASATTLPAVKAQGVCLRLRSGQAGAGLAQMDEHFLAREATKSTTALNWLPPTVNGDLLDQNHSYRWGSEVYGDWDQLLSYANSSSLCGFSDWRLPTVAELQQLYADAGSFHNLQALMPNILAQLYWSSTSNSSNTAIAVNLVNGLSVPVARSSYQRLILVR